MNKRLHTTDEGWSVTIEHARIGYIHIDFRLGLDVADDFGVVSVTIGTMCRLIRNGTEITIKTDDVSTLSSALTLFNTEVEDLSIRKDGTLTLQFANRDQLLVPPLEAYEAWEMGCDDEFLIVCAPGGSVTIFTHDSET